MECISQGTANVLDLTKRTARKVRPEDMNAIGDSNNTLISILQMALGVGGLLKAGLLLFSFGGERGTSPPAV